MDPWRPASLVTVAVCQMGPVLGQIAANLRKVEVAVLGTAEVGAQVVVLPELVTTGYVFEPVGQARGLAERVDGPSLGAITTLAAAHNMVIVGGFAELAADDESYNSAFLIDRAGVAAAYRKAHLWADESRWFTPGRQPPPVVQSDRGRVAVLICYDLEFPEWTRIAALSGGSALRAHQLAGFLRARR
jgi:predicted amidohydrolase